MSEVTFQLKLASYTTSEESVLHIEINVSILLALSYKHKYQLVLLVKIS